MKNFIYTIPTTVYFGKNQIKKLPEALPNLGSPLLLVYGQGSIKKTNLYNSITTILKNQDITWYELSDVQPNPRFSTVQKGIQQCRQNNIQGILAVGGGSVIDCAKAIAAGIYHNNPWSLFTDSTQTINQALPIGTILTLAGTGSEMNGNAVISNETTQEKLAIRFDILRPKFSILDPTLTYSLPPQQTAAGIVDIFSHILEQYFSPTKEAFLQDRLAEAMLKTIIHYAPLAINDPTNYEARSNIMWTSSLALNKLLSYGKITDWATHQMEHALSAITDVTHGVGLAVLTPYWMSSVLHKETIEKFQHYAKNVWGLKDTDPMKLAEQSIQQTKEFFSSLGMPSSLKELGVTQDQLPEMTTKSVAYGPIGNFKQLTQQEVYTIFHNAYTSTLTSSTQQCPVE